MSTEWSPPKRCQKEIEARWTKKHGKSYFGYKLSANADKRYKLIRKLKVNTASEYDANRFEDGWTPPTPAVPCSLIRATWTATAKHDWRTSLRV
jgi:hypothetical protein